MPESGYFISIIFFRLSLRIRHTHELYMTGRNDTDGECDCGILSTLAGCHCGRSQCSTGRSNCLGIGHEKKRTIMRVRDVS
jgi:hypothetical protein